MMMRIFLCLIVSLWSLTAQAQGTDVAFGSGLEHDSTLPIEATGENLEVRQAENVAIFTGKVVVVQGQLKLTADELRVENQPDGGGIDRIIATGNVTMVNGIEAAEGQRAVYSIADSTLVMTGNVLLTQGSSAIAGERLDVDLASGNGKMTGRVKTVLQSGNE